MDRRCAHSTRPRELLVGFALVASTAIAAPAVAAPPPGHSAYLNGMHDIQSLEWMLSATQGCDKGWITDLQYIGTSGQAAGSCHEEATSAGVSMIIRLDVGGGQAYPHDPGQAPGYAAAFADFVDDCSDVHVWIVGNEPNISLGQSDPDCTSDAYAEAYAAVHQAVHALPGHADDLLLVAPNSPYSPGCLQSLRSIIEGIQARGVTPDGFSIHPYTRAPNAAALAASYVTDGATQNDGTIDECPGPATWNDTWHSHFRIYQDYIAVIESYGLAGSAVFITESGNACDPVPDNDCYPDANIGYFQALYQEVATHNASATTKIRAITPYRWTLNDDGSGRDFEIGARPQLLADLEAAFSAGHTWTEPSCDGGGDSCTDDDDCAGQSICDLSAKMCMPTQPCGPDGACPAGELCRVPQGDCVPEHRGEAALDIDPPMPDPFSDITLDASSSIGYTNIGLSLLGPAGPVAVEGNDINDVGGVFHWPYEATVGDVGTYRATFVADPGASTVYAISYFNVGMPDFPSGTGESGGADGGTATDGSTGASSLSGLTAGTFGNDEASSGCGCRSSGPRGAWLFAVVAFCVAGVRRRRAQPPQSGNCR